MNPPLYPLLFEPIYKGYVWGGNRITSLFRRPPQPGVCAESWEITDRSEGTSLVINGPYAGENLHKLYELFAYDLVGSAGAGRTPAFPLLVKIIDARERLSLQVHPDERAARLYGGEPKTEMWYTLEAAPEAGVFCGFNHPANEDEFRSALQTNTVEKLLWRISIKSGDAVFVPGGRVHAVDRGCLLLEVQQNSDTTFRIYDWGRLGSNGCPRPLHINQAFKVIDWNDVRPPKQTPRFLSDSLFNPEWELVRCPFFVVTRKDLCRKEPISNDGRSFHALFVASGTLLIDWTESHLEATAGTSCLIPASLRNYSIAPGAVHTTVIRISLV